MPYIQQVAVGRLPELNVYGHDYPTPDGTAVSIILKPLNHILIVQNITLIIKIECYLRIANL